MYSNESNKDKGGIKRPFDMLFENKKGGGVKG